jgi:hypothetical protein
MEHFTESKNARPGILGACERCQGANGQQYIAQAMQQNDPDFRIMAIRAARELNANAIGVVRQLVNDADVQVRRECALALHHNKAPEAAELWATLAAKHDGKDRWYLEALGIRCRCSMDSLLRGL